METAQIRQLIKKNRPNLSESSITTYTSMFRNLMNKMGKDEDYIMKNPTEVIKYLKDKNKNTIKNVLAMMVSLTDNDKYREEMMKQSDILKSERKEQKKTDKQSDNWMDWLQIVDVFNAMYKRTMPLLKKAKLTEKDKTEVMDMLLLAVYVLIPPRRSKDYAEMKLRNYDEKRDNYYKGGKFYFNQYKTGKFYGKQDVVLPPKLKRMVSMWMAKQDGDYMFFDKNKKPYTNVKITNRLNSIFGKNISSTMLRHIYLSHYYKDMPSLKEMGELAENMGHTVEEAMLYRKVD